MLVPDCLGLGKLEPKTAIASLWRQAQRYHFASLQDRHPVVASRHNAYAVALIDALNEMATEEEIRAVTGGDAKKLRAEIIAVQDKIEIAAFKLAKELEAKGIKFDLGQIITGQMTVGPGTTYGGTFKTNLPTQGYFPGWKDKVGPVIVVETPEVEEEIRQNYDTRGVRFVRLWRGERA